jgi:hypothetical protein
MIQCDTAFKINYTCCAITLYATQYSEHSVEEDECYCTLTLHISHVTLAPIAAASVVTFQSDISLLQKSDWGTLVPRINVENGIKLGFLLE